ncbi:probable protein phosphatase 2C 27 [Cucurbita maxima]|uniref:protein-serine/threonine phosphatase n=1 Tax=Cucurbita maxima TaxID=3661 RepID=A0A6J1IK99_CUCMA|nr:probable protein phosphatase 2C 27 [Cucurbita maxima]
MATGLDFSPPFTLLEGGGYNKDNVSATDDESSDSFSSLKQMTSGKPPRHLSVMRHSVSSIKLLGQADLSLDAETLGNKSPDGKTGFLPVLRSGSCSEKGPKQYMEDEHICIDDLVEHIHACADFTSPGAFYGVFDGHGGTDAAAFVRKNILRFIVEDSCFPISVEKAIKSAFLKADYAFADASSLDISSGTTALTAFIFGRTMIIANAGDCRAVLGRRGKAIEVSKDHKPNCASEKLRIEKLGGVIYDGYLNGQLSVARAIGDWHMKGAKGSACPLSAEPELQELNLTEEDEFLIMGCDGLWDVMSSQYAITMARKELMLHNDPERCSRELVREALKRNTCDNLTVIVVCFSTDPPPRIEIPPTRVRRSISLEGLNLLKGVLDCNS